MDKNQSKPYVPRTSTEVFNNYPGSLLQFKSITAFSTSLANTVTAMGDSIKSFYLANPTFKHLSMNFSFAYVGANYQCAIILTYVN